MSDEVKQQELVDFIFEQDKLRKLDMNEASSDDHCGCVMVHYGKERLGIKNNFSCGRIIFADQHKIIFENIYDDIFTFLGVGKRVYTYGEIQQNLTRKGYKPTKEMKNKTVAELRKEGYKVSVHHFRHRKNSTRREKPKESYLFDYKDDIDPKGGKTVVFITGKGESGLGGAVCANMDHYNKAEGLRIALSRAVDNLS